MGKRKHSIEVDDDDDGKFAKTMSAALLSPHFKGLGPWGPNLVKKYTSARFGSYSTGTVLTNEESRLLSDYFYHTLAAKASGELCLKYIFAFGAFARMPLLHGASDWKVPTTFIYSHEDWMNYQGAQEAHKHMKVPCEIIEVPQLILTFMNMAAAFSYQRPLPADQVKTSMEFYFEGEGSPSSRGRGRGG